MNITRVKSVKYASRTPLLTCTYRLTRQTYLQFAKTHTREKICMDRLVTIYYRVQSHKNECRDFSLSCVSRLCFVCLVVCFGVVMFVLFFLCVISLLSIDCILIIQVRDEDRESLRVFGRFCNKSLPAPIRTFSNQMWINFVTDGSFTRPGFRATYISG